MKPDLFDLPGLRALEPFYRRHREPLLYLFFGGLTTLVSIALFALFYEGLGLNELVANGLSWVFAVLFAFLTNRAWVFPASARGGAAFLRQMASFFAGRAATLGVEELILLVFVTRLRLPALPVKAAAQIIVILLNYCISKLLIFRRSGDGG